MSFPFNVHREKPSRTFGTLDALLILFIALKLCDVVAWSWVWVMAPLWVPVAIYCFMHAVDVFRSLKPPAR